MAEHGGKREGAGRPASPDKKIQKSIKIDPIIYKQIGQLDGTFISKIERGLELLLREQEIRQKLNELYIQQEVLSVEANKEYKRADRIAEVAKAQQDLKALNHIIKIFEWVLEI
ncbi:hypothetical protein [Fusobacterium necrophorum]|uniref:hypothetical protein n=1 Tax=Fusobacterium necrophorum TaxID=859 RepID=UPI000AE43176|nr:hypothetical protein [Fusobacterium necrophorum]